MSTLIQSEVYKLRNSSVLSLDSAQSGPKQPVKEQTPTQALTEFSDKFLKARQAVFEELTIWISQHHEDLQPDSPLDYNISSYDAVNWQVNWRVSDSKGGWSCELKLTVVDGQPQVVENSFQQTRYYDDFNL